MAIDDEWEDHVRQESANMSNRGSEGLRGLAEVSGFSLGYIGDLVEQGNGELRSLLPLFDEETGELLMESRHPTVENVRYRQEKRRARWEAEEAATTGLDGRVAQAHARSRRPLD
jgi:hypothetical protein